MIMENNTGSEPLLYKELPKAQRKELQNEYFKTPEAKKMNRLFIIVAVIIAVVMVAGAVIGVMTGHDLFFGTVPVFFICIWPAVISQQKYEKWLEAEKNIITKRKN